MGKGLGDSMSERPDTSQMEHLVVQAGSKKSQHSRSLGCTISWEEFAYVQAAARAPLVIATLRGIVGFSDVAFRRHLRAFFPLLTGAIACRHAAPDVQSALSELFLTRIGPLLSSS